MGLGGHGAATSAKFSPSHDIYTYIPLHVFLLLSPRFHGKPFQALKSRNLRAFLEGSVAHVLPVFVAGSKAVAVEQLAALCDHFEVRSSWGRRFWPVPYGSASATKPPQFSVLWLEVSVARGGGWIPVLYLYGNMYESGGVQTGKGIEGGGGSRIVRTRG